MTAPVATMTTVTVATATKMKDFRDLHVPLLPLSPRTLVPRKNQLRHEPMSTRVLLVSNLLLTFF